MTIQKEGSGSTASFVDSIFEGIQKMLPLSMEGTGCLMIQ